MKVLVVFGTRPEAIKMCPIVKELQLDSSIDTKICVTAQHKEMLYQVLNLFNITPDFDLNIMKPNQDLFDITSNILLGMRDVLMSFVPDWILVHGDTTTCFAVSLAAFYKQVKIAHVEAGLRTYNLMSPWPEEMNRQLTDRIADIYFAPTNTSASNLLNEGVSPEKVFVTGNTVIDALLSVSSRLETDSKLRHFASDLLIKAGYNINRKKEIILITAHRRESVGKGFDNISSAILELSRKNKNIDFVYPVHLNPNVRKTMYSNLGNVENIFLIDPLDYLPFVLLMKLSKIILTDSGGIQEEAPSLGKPVLVMRNTTERPEAVSQGGVVLCGTDVDVIVSLTMDLLLSNDKYQSMAKIINPYGDGMSSQRIVSILKQ